MSGRLIRRHRLNAMSAIAPDASALGLIGNESDGCKHALVIGFEGRAVEALRELLAEKYAAIAAHGARFERN